MAEMNLISTKLFNTLKKNRYGIILMTIAAFFVAIGQLLWKIVVDLGVI